MCPLQKKKKKYIYPFLSRILRNQCPFVSIPSTMNVQRPYFKALRREVGEMIQASRNKEGNAGIERKHNDT